MLVLICFGIKTSDLTLNHVFTLATIVKNPTCWVPLIKVESRPHGGGGGGVVIEFHLFLTAQTFGISGNLSRILK